MRCKTHSPKFKNNTQEEHLRICKIQKWDDSNAENMGTTHMINRKGVYMSAHAEQKYAWYVHQQCKQTQ